MTNEPVSPDNDVKLRLRALDVNRARPDQELKLIQIFVCMVGERLRVKPYYPWRQARIT
jgi:hypothetical protein